MSYMKGNLMSKTRKLVKGLAVKEPLWLKSMEKAPPATFPRAESKLKPISFPEDTYVTKFDQKHLNAKFEDSIKISSFDPPPARVFAWRVLELKEQGVDEELAMSVADMEYLSGRKAKKKAYARLKQIAKLQGKTPPPNPYPSAVNEIQAEERKLVHDRFYNPQTRKILDKLKDERTAWMMDRK
ncbi:hypothetical protein ACS0TY_035156 [Phlomoides rotata]